MKRKILILIFFLGLSSPSSAGDGGTRIRVALVRGAKNLAVKTRGKIVLAEKITGAKYVLLPDSRYILEPRKGKLKIDGKILSPPVTLASTGSKERLKISGRTYMGELTITVEEGLITIIENLDIEDYLAGVLPFEMNPSWPPEALKAQAVVSRTFALKNINSGDLYDITCGTERQVYKGINLADGKIYAAIAETEGEILTYGGEPIKAYFHSCCGGHTASNADTWGEKEIPPLIGVRDPYCRFSGKYSWSAFISSGKLLSFIHKKGSTALRIKSVAVDSRDDSKRAEKFRFYTDSSLFYANAREMREYFGTGVFKSTLVRKISKTGNGYKFYGRGWGHGVGMCQEGAKVMAQKGRDYEDILRHYYPRAEITKIK